MSSWGEPSPDEDPMVDMVGTKKAPAVSVLVVYWTIPPLFEGDITPCIVSMLLTLEGRTASKNHQSTVPSSSVFPPDLWVPGGERSGDVGAAGAARCGPQSWPRSPPHWRAPSPLGKYNDVSQTFLSLVPLSWSKLSQQYTKLIVRSYPEWDFFLIDNNILCIFLLWDLCWVERIFFGF